MCTEINMYGVIHEDINKFGNWILIKSTLIITSEIKGN